MKISNERRKWINRYWWGGDTSSAGPSRRKATGIEETDPEHILGGPTLGLGLLDVRRKVDCHFVGNGIRDPKPIPLSTTFFNEFNHGVTSTFNESRARSIASRAVRHSITPVSRDRFPSGERL
jgi:hypothetical protein